MSSVKYAIYRPFATGKQTRVHIPTLIHGLLLCVVGKTIGGRNTGTIGRSGLATPIRVRVALLAERRK